MTALAAARARVADARRALDRAEHALAQLRSPAAFLALSACVSDLAAVRPVLERHAERMADAHAEALRGLGEILSQPLADAGVPCRAL